MNLRTRILIPTLGIPALLIFIIFFLTGTLAAYQPKTVSAPIYKTAVSQPTATLPTCTGDPLRIMPVGDTITTGKFRSTSAGYRLPLYLALRNNGYNVTFVGSQTDGPPPPGFDHFHESYPSIENQHFANFLTDYLTASEPDMLLIHTGTNNMNSEPSFNAAIPDLQSAIDQAVTDGVSDIFVAQIIGRECEPSETGCLERDARTDLYNTNIAISITNATIVNMNSGAGLIYEEFPNGDFQPGNQLHPVDSGYLKMATTWYNAITPTMSRCDTDLQVSSITTSTTASQPFTYQILASGYPMVTGFSVQSAPEGVSVSSTGLISWIPDVDHLGNNVIEIAVTNGDETVVGTYNVEVVLGDILVVQNPAETTVLKNGSVQFSTAVTNTGSTTLTSVPVSYPGSSCATVNLGSLAPNQRKTATCTLSNLTADATLTAEVNAVNSLSDPVFGSDSSNVEVIDPGIKLTVTPSIQAIDPGDTANFTVSIQNSGDVSLTGVKVTGFSSGTCNKTRGTLASGNMDSYTCTVSGLTDDITWAVKVTGTHPIGTVTNTKSVNVSIGSLSTYLPFMEK